MVKRPAKRPAKRPGAEEARFLGSTSAQTRRWQQSSSDGACTYVGI